METGVLLPTMGADLPIRDHLVQGMTVDID